MVNRAGWAGRGAVNYREIHGHPRPPRPVVAAGLAPGPLPGRRNPGAGGRAAPRSGLGRQSLPSAGSAGAGDMGEAVAASAPRPGLGVHRAAAAHPDAPAPAPHHGRGADTAPAGDREPLDHSGHRRLRSVAGHLAPVRLPRAGRPDAGGSRTRRRRGVAVGCLFHAGLRLRVGAAPGELLPRRSGAFAARGRVAYSLGCVPDRRRDPVAAGRAVAHRRGRGARRQGGWDPAGPQPRRGTGAPGGAPYPDPYRRGRRRGRRAAPAGAGPARRHPAAAGIPGHAAGHGPGRTR
jgi:hypothetical protein